MNGIRKVHKLIFLQGSFDNLLIELFFRLPVPSNTSPSLPVPISILIRGF